MRKLVVSFVLLLSILFVTRSLFVHAQESDALSDNDVSVATLPEVPGAYQDVTMTLSSYTINLDQYMIIWSYNGKVSLGGNGQKQFSFKTGAIGEKTFITAQIKQGSVTLLTKRIVIVPSEVDLLWETANAYTPPFYRGKALPTSESIIRVVAIPHTSNDSGTVYDWYRNYDAIGEASGYGKNTFLFKNSPLNRNETIAVDTTENDTGAIAKNTTTITITDPILHFYQNNPLMGTLYNQTVDSGVTIDNTDVTLVAEPYFITPRSLDSSDLLYTWNIDGSKITPPEQRNILTLRHGGTSGDTTVSLHMESISKLLITLEKSLAVTIK